MELNKTLLIQKSLNTTLNIYTSKDSLTTRFYDYSSVYLLPAICLFGIITSVICIVVIIKINKLNENVYMYMMINSVCDLAFLCTQITTIITRCGILCAYGYTYGAKFFELYIYLYGGYVIVVFSAIVDISVSIDRVLSFDITKKRIITRKSFYTRCLIIFIATAIFLSPVYIFARDIVPVGLLVSVKPNSNNINETDVVTVEEVLFNKIFRASWLFPAQQVVLSVIGFGKGPVLIAAVFFVNLFVVIKFKQHLEKKKKVTASTYLRFIYFNFLSFLSLSHLF